MIKTIAQAISQEGGRAFYTGGYVRDYLLNAELRPEADIDIEVFNIEERQLMSILARFAFPKQVGKAYPIIKIAGYPQLDFSMALTDDYEGAALRRDFTINAVMQDVLTGEILDFVGGQQDIKNRLVRHTRAQVFKEDPLRVYRAAVLAARLNFDIYPETLDLMKVTDLSNLPGERIFDELQKLLLLAVQPAKGLRYLAQTKILEKQHPALFNLIGCIQEKEYHPEGDVWEHTLLAVDAASGLKMQTENPAALMWAALLHDIGKPPTSEMKVGKIVSYGHDQVGAELARKYLRELKASNILIREVTTLVKEHMQPLLLYKQREEVTDKAIRRLVNRVNLMDLLLLAEADYLGRNNSDDFMPIRTWFLERLEKMDLDPRQKIEPLVKGRDLIALGLKPGKNFKNILHYAFDLQLEGKSKTEIINYIKEYKL